MQNRQMNTLLHLRVITISKSVISYVQPENSCNISLAGCYKGALNSCFSNSNVHTNYQ